MKKKPSKSEQIDALQQELEGARALLVKRDKIISSMQEQLDRAGKNHDANLAENQRRSKTSDDIIKKLVDFLMAATAGVTEAALVVNEDPAAAKKPLLDVRSKALEVLKDKDLAVWLRECASAAAYADKLWTWAIMSAMGGIVPLLGLGFAVRREACKDESAAKAAPAPAVSPF